jgi:hypothetical protein
VRIRQSYAYASAEFNQGSTTRGSRSWRLASPCGGFLAAQIDVRLRLCAQHLQCRLLNLIKGCDRLCIRLIGLLRDDHIGELGCFVHV